MENAVKLKITIEFDYKTKTNNIEEMINEALEEAEGDLRAYHFHSFQFGEITQVDTYVNDKLIESNSEKKQQLHTRGWF